jgi:hypothetical protein
MGWGKMLAVMLQKVFPLSVFSVAIKSIYGAQKLIRVLHKKLGVAQQVILFYES